MLTGFSAAWWNRKHNLHHMFTNRIGKDEDIEHSYNRYLFFFLFFKWKFDSLLADFPNKKRFILVVIHWLIVLN